MSAGELAPYDGSNGSGPGEGTDQASSHRTSDMMSCPVCGAVATTGGMQHESWCTLIERGEENGTAIHIDAGTIGIGLSHDIENSIREARALARAWQAYADELLRAIREERERVIPL